MAHKKGVGSSRNGRDSNPKMLGVKRFGGNCWPLGATPCTRVDRLECFGMNTLLHRTTPYFSPSTAYTLTCFWVRLYCSKTTLPGIIE